ALDDAVDSRDADVGPRVAGDGVLEEVERHGHVYRADANAEHVDVAGRSATGWRPLVGAQSPVADRVVASRRPVSVSRVAGHLGEPCKSRGRRSRPRLPAQKAIAKSGAP